MGFESLDAYTSGPEKGVYVLTLTSNPGAADFFQKPFDGYNSVAEYIATGLSERSNEHSAHLGMVVGATQSSNLATVLKAHGTASLLIPGIGAQGGKVTDLSRVLSGHAGIPLINSSRGIIYAGGQSGDWKNEVRKSASATKKSLNMITSRYV
jgi:orotidine-5'-phosphate decarboxylase